VANPKTWGRWMKKEETNDIVQYLIPTLESLNIPKVNCKVDVTTEKSGMKRGDVWVSLVPQSRIDFEKNIVALIEAKHRNTVIGDIDWRDAMEQGKEKSIKQGLNYYLVTNCKTEVRYYNSHTDEEILLDGKVLIRFVPLEILQKIQTQVTSENSYVIHKTSKITQPLSETKFRTTLKKLADIYRSAGLKKGDERIDPSISFVALKNISEKEKKKRTLNNVIKLWDDLRDIATGKSVGDLKVEFQTMVKLIWGKDSAYKNNIYKDFKDLIVFPSKLKKEHFEKIYCELDSYHFHGANFDLFGSIYEEFASQTKKKEFGEFYTRRHITGMVARLLLRHEVIPRAFSICDPSCGTGGFLTEGYKTMINNYSLAGRLNNGSLNNLKNHVFWGYDNDEKSVARTKINMFLVGDGHIHIYDIDDSLIWNDTVKWEEQNFDYIMTNPPMGKYDGVAKKEDFDFTNEKRGELLFAEKVIKATKHGGEIAIVINDGALEAPSRENFRKKLLEHCNIYAIISLTKYAFAPYTKEKTYVLFMQKKQKEDIGTIQSFPIWHYIVDYDGYANSDKRYKTKWHNDLPELEEKFNNAIALACAYPQGKDTFDENRQYYEREVNNREKEEGLWGMKFGYVGTDEINDSNFYNLLSEYHLRPVEINYISETEFDKEYENILDELTSIMK
jgi:type I restriction enzyme M protein